MEFTLDSCVQVRKKENPSQDRKTAERVHGMDMSHASGVDSFVGKIAVI